MLDNKLQLYFPQIIQQVGWLLLIFGILVVVQAVPFPTPWIGLALILAGIIFSFTAEGTRLDAEKKRIKRYLGLFGIKLGTWKPLPELNEIVFTSSKYSQQIHAIVSRKQLNTKLFRAFLKGPDCKILFSSDSDGDFVKQDVLNMAHQLQLPAVNYNVKPPVKLA